MKQAIIKTIVTYINSVGPQDSFNLSVIVQIPIDILTECLFELVEKNILIFDHEKFIFRLGQNASNYLASKSDHDYFINQLENIHSSPLCVINSIEDIKRFLKLDQYNYSEDTAYHLFRIKKNKNEKIQTEKATNKWRDIIAPSINLKYRQKWILNNVLSLYSPPDCVHGFVKGRSIKTNALCHINRNEIGCIDIKDFFPSITIEQVTHAIHCLGFNYEVANALALLTTYKGRLPQGAPTSPALANIVMKPIDDELTIYAIENGLAYTRYADDITISGESGISGHLDKITCLIEKHGFMINKKKTHVMNSRTGKRVTGLSVGSSVKVPLQFKRKLRQEIYYCSKFGLSYHLRKCINNGQNYVNYMNYLYGKAYYIKMIEPKLGDIYLNELDRIFK